VSLGGLGDIQRRTVLEIRVLRRLARALFVQRDPGRRRSQARPGNLGRNARSRTSATAFTRDSGSSGGLHDALSGAWDAEKVPTRGLCGPLVSERLIKGIVNRLLAA
jgi:hypothetical protein